MSKGGKQAPKPVSVDGKVYPSIYAAALALKTSPGNITWTVNHTGVWHGMNIKLVNNPFTAVLSNEMADKLGITSEKSVADKKSVMPKLTKKGVRVESDSKIFPSIKAAALYLNENRYKLCNILRRDGKYKAADGEVYRAIDPAHSRNLKKGTGYVQTKMKLPESKPVVNTVDTSLAKSILKQHVNAYLQKDCYKEARELLETIEKL